MKIITEYIVNFIIWIVFIVLAVAGVSVYPLAILFAVRLLELIIISYRTGRKFGRSVLHCIFSGMLLGYVWWEPMKRYMKYDELDEEDFVEDGLEPWREKF